MYSNITVCESNELLFMSNLIFYIYDRKRIFLGKELLISIN